MELYDALVVVMTGMAILLLLVACVVLAIPADMYLQPMWEAARGA